MRSPQCPKIARADRPADKADEKHAEGFEDADDRAGSMRKIKLAENQRCHRAVEQEIVPFDQRADGARNQGAPQLAAVLDFGKTGHGDFRCCH